MARMHFRLLVFTILLGTANAGSLMRRVQPSLSATTVSIEGEGEVRLVTASAGHLMRRAQPSPSAASVSTEGQVRLDKPQFRPHHSGNQEMEIMPDASLKGGDPEDFDVENSAIDSIYTDESDVLRQLAEDSNVSQCLFERSLAAFKANNTERRELVDIVIEYETALNDKSVSYNEDDVKALEITAREAASRIVYEEFNNLFYEAKFTDFVNITEEKLARFEKAVSLVGALCGDSAYDIESRKQQMRKWIKPGETPTPEQEGNWSDIAATVFDNYTDCSEDLFNTSFFMDGFGTNFTTGCTEGSVLDEKLQEGYRNKSLEAAKAIDHDAKLVLALHNDANHFGHRFLTHLRDGTVYSDDDSFKSFRDEMHAELVRPDLHPTIVRNLHAIDLEHHGAGLPGKLSRACLNLDQQDSPHISEFRSCYCSQQRPWTTCTILHQDSLRQEQAHMLQKFQDAKQKETHSSNQNQDAKQKVRNKKKTSDDFETKVRSAVATNLHPLSALGATPTQASLLSENALTRYESNQSASIPDAYVEGVCMMCMGPMGHCAIGSANVEMKSGGDLGVHAFDFWAGILNPGPGSDSCLLMNCHLATSAKLPALTWGGVKDIWMPVFNVAVITNYGHTISQWCLPHWFMHIHAAVQLTYDLGNHLPSGLQWIGSALQALLFDFGAMGALFFPFLGRMVTYASAEVGYVIPIIKGIVRGNLQLYDLVKWFQIYCLAAPDNYHSPSCDAVHSLATLYRHHYELFKVHEGHVWATPLINYFKMMWDVNQNTYDAVCNTGFKRCMHEKNLLKGAESKFKIDIEIFIGIKLPFIGKVGGFQHVWGFDIPFE